MPHRPGRNRRDGSCGSLADEILVVKQDNAVTVIACATVQKDNIPVLGSGRCSSLDCIEGADVVKRITEQAVASGRGSIINKPDHLRNNDKYSGRVLVTVGILNDIVEAV